MCLKIFVFVFCLTNSYLDAATIHSREKRGKFQVDSFLEDFGYMDQLGDTGGGHDSSDRERAVREFQKMVGLPVTGELNKATVKKMKAPRCGFRDVLRPSERPAELNNGPKKVQLMPLSNEYKWQDNRVTWKIMGYTGQLDRSLQRQSYINAFKKWSDVANLDIKEVGSGHADILIKYTRGDHYDGSPFDGRGRNLAHAFFPGTADLSGDTHFDDDEQWTLGTNEGTNLEIVAAHEFGHALGLGHSADRNALMAPYYNGYDANYKLGSDDIYRMRRLYGNDGRSTRIINQTPAPYRLVEGGDLSLICVYEGNGTETIYKNKIKFDKDGIDIPIDDEFRESVVTGSDTVTLTLMSSRPNGLEIQDAGKYQCSYERETSFKTVEVFDIEYTENAQVPVIPEKDKDKVEKKVELECKARFSQLTDAADEVYTLEWFKGGKNVKEVAGLKDRCTFGTNNVTINDVVRKDMGEYQCVFVFSNDDRINQTVQLTAPPEIEKTFTKSKNLVQGDDWTVVCPVTGFPYPIVHWTKDGEELNVEDDKRIQIEDNGNIKNSKLVIFSLTFEDKGEYSCHANSTTSFNTTVGTISLSVKGQRIATRTTRAPRNPNRPTPTTNPKKHNLCNLKFDAVFLNPRDRRVYILRERKLYRLEADRNGIEESYTKVSRKYLTPRVPTNPGAAVHNGRHLYIFKDRKLFRYTNFRLDHGYPKELNVTFFQKVQAAIFYRNVIYVFKGDEYSFWHENYDTRLPTGYPKKIKEHWGGLTDNLEAAVNLDKRYTYFFKGSKYFKFENGRNRTLYRKDKDGAWLGCGNQYPH